MKTNKNHLPNLKRTNIKKLIGILTIATTILLLIPLIAMLFTDAVDWTWLDFLLMGTLIFCSGLASILIIRKSENIVYRVACSLAFATAFLLVWVNLAVGLIGAGPNPGNWMYIVVLAVGSLGALIANFRPGGMQWAMFATALSLVLLTVIALIMGMQHYPGSSVIELLSVNGFFIVLFTISALLFRHAA